MEDKIEEIGTDDEGRLYLRPSCTSFPMIYREAMEVRWNKERGYFLAVLLVNGAVSIGITKY